MPVISPKTITLLAVQVSVLIGLSIGLTALLLPLINAVAIISLCAAILAGYVLLVGYLGLSSLYLLLHNRQMNQRHVVVAALAIGLFALVWSGVFERGYNTIIHETRAIMSTFDTDKGLLIRLSIVNAVRDTYKHSLARKIDRDICRNEAEYLKHLPVLQDEGVPFSKLIRELEANYRSVSCF